MRVLLLRLGNDVTKLTSSLKLNSPSKTASFPSIITSNCNLLSTTLPIPIELSLNHQTPPIHITDIMPRGNASTTKVFYQGESEGFAIFVESEELVRKWKDDKTVPLTEVVAGWKIFVTE